MGWNAFFCLWSSPENAEHRTECFQILHADGNCDINHVTSTKWTVIHRAAFCGTPKDVAMLHRNGADTTILQDALGWSALHYATLSQSLLVICELQKEEYGLDINMCDFRGWSPLHLAAWIGAESTASTLLRLGADPHLRTKATTFEVPVVLQQQSATPVEVAQARGSSHHQAFLNALQKSDIAVQVDEGDVYWDSVEEVSAL